LNKTAESIDLDPIFVKRTDYDFDGMFAMYEKLKILVKPFFEGGGMVLWNRPANQIPAGWREVEDWRGRLPMGYDPADADFNSVGKNGGKKDHVQTIEQMPKHAHLMPYQILIQSAGKANSDAFHRVDGAYTNRYTNETGGSKPMPLLNPFRTVVFIEMIP
jgi:hypothetical protein